MLWVGIPVLLVVIMFSYSVVVLLDVEHSADPEDMTVHVQGFQFQWQFTYDLNDLGPGSDPNNNGTVVVLGTPDQEPQLVLPAGERIEFELSSNDVIHSFYVRDFLYKLDVIPGRDNKFSVTIDPDAIGKVYNGQCAELCGIGHAFMRFTVKVLSRADFDAWIADQSGSNLAAQP
jgi:cytochrome c oxidase subunit 2